MKAGDLEMTEVQPTRYTIGEPSGSQRFLGVSVVDEKAVCAALDTAGIKYERPDNLVTLSSPLCILFDFGDGCDCDKVQAALNTVVRNPIEEKPIRPLFGGIAHFG